MSYVRQTFTGQDARRIARLGSVTSRYVPPNPWWPEDVCKRIEKIVWVVYSLGEQGDDWHEFRAYDHAGNILSVRRVEGY